MSNANAMAFPVFAEWEDARDLHTGLSKRELFAAMAMQGWIANKDRPQHFLPEDDMAYCVKVADCLLAALST